MMITLKNGNKEVAFNRHPFYLSKTPNFSGLSANLNIVESGEDGGMFLSSRYNQREVELEGYIDRYNKNDTSLEQYKQLLYSVCNPKDLLTIAIEQNGQEYFLYGYPVSFPTFKNDWENQNKQYQSVLIQLTCTDPFLYKNKQLLTFSTNTPSFSFPLNLGNTKMGEKKTTLIENIYNDGMMSCPLEIHMKALSEVVNPYLINVYTQEKIQLNTTLLTGDEVVIKTGKKKELYRIRNNVKEHFFYSLDLTSTFLQLEKGDNVLRFGAESNPEGLEVQIHYQERLGGI